MKKLLTIFTALLFVGCAFNNNDAVQAENERNIKRDLEKKAQYEPYTGTYTGTLYSLNDEFPIQITIFMDPKKVGETSKGEPIFETELKGFYRRLDIVTTDFRFNTRVIQETGDLILSNDKTTNPDDIVTILGKLNNNTITGDVKTSTGLLGNFIVTLKTKNTQVPAVGDQNEKNERLRLLFEPLKGKYIGIVTPPPQLAAPFEVQLELFVIEKTLNNNKTEPALNSYYQRSDDPTGELALNLNVNYMPEYKPAKIVISGQKAGNTGRVYSINVNGILSNSKIIGTHTDQRGYVSQIELIKQ